MLVRVYFCFMVTVIFYTSPLLAEVAAVEELVVQATEAHDDGDFQKAIEIYERLIEDGHVNGHVLFNLGNAYYRQGKVGAATAAYLASAKYLPRSPDLSANLEYVRKNAVDKLQTHVEKPWWAIPASWSDYFSVKELTYSAAIAIGLGSLIWLLGWYVSSFEQLFRYIAMAAWTLGFVVGYGLTVKQAAGNQWGAVIEATAEVFSGPNEKNNKSLFVLHEAAPVLIQQKEKDWAQIQISDGKKGWIKRSSLKFY